MVRFQLNSEKVPENPRPVRFADRKKTEAYVIQRIPVGKLFRIDNTAGHFDETAPIRQR